MHSKTEIVKRLREIVRADYGNRQIQIEVVTRRNQHAHVFPEGISPTDHEALSRLPESEAWAYDRLVTTSITDDHRQYGAVIDLNVFKREGRDWDLDDQYTIWIGTDTRPAERIG